MLEGGTGNIFPKVFSFHVSFSQGAIEYLTVLSCFSSISLAKQMLSDNLNTPRKFFLLLLILRGETRIQEWTGADLISGINKDTVRTAQTQDSRTHVCRK